MLTATLIALAAIIHPVFGLLAGLANGLVVTAVPGLIALAAVAFTLDPATVVQLLLAIVLPILVGLVTTRVTSSAHKAILLAALTLITSLLTELASALAGGVVYDLGVALVKAVPAFAISVATYYGLWNPTGLTDKVQDSGRTADEWDDPDRDEPAEVFTAGPPLDDPDAPEDDRPVNS